MPSERNLAAVAPILLTANGGAQGQVILATTLGLFVKQIITIQAPSLPPLSVQVKAVTNNTDILVGPTTGPLSAKTDVSLYTVAAGSFVFANAQPKATLPMEERMYASYIQEPSNSWRVTPVDSFGNSFDSTNPLPIAFDGDIDIGIVEVKGPSGNLLDPNADGSINTVTLAQLIPFKFDEIDLSNSVIAGQTVPTTVTYKQGGSAVATLTLTYDVSANLLTVVRS